MDWKDPHEVQQEDAQGFSFGMNNPTHTKGHPGLQQLGRKGPEGLGDSELRVSQQCGRAAKAAS